MRLRTRLLAVSAAAILVATSTLGVAEARGTSPSQIACAAVDNLELLCEIRGAAQALTALRDTLDTKALLRGFAQIEAQWIWRVLRDM
jgi:hypothetical protein